MNRDDRFEQWIDLLCNCEEGAECQWHHRLRDRDTDPRELGQEMQEIVETSHAIERGVIDPPEGWERFRGKNYEYWKPRQCYAELSVGAHNRPVIGA